MALTVGTNTYVTDVEFQAYIAQSIHALSLVTTSGTREAALVSAFRMIERQVYEGEQTVAPPTQTASFPRTGLTDAYGAEVDDATVPQQVEDAQCELAIALLGNAAGASAGAGGPSSNIKSLGAGSARIEYFRPNASTWGTGRFPVPVMDLLAPFLSSSADAAATLGGEDYGTDGESAFTDDARYDLSRGY